MRLFFNPRQVLLVAMCAAGLSAQAAPVSVEQLRADASGPGASHAAPPGMPWVRSIDANVAQRINNVVYIEQLQTLPPGRKPTDLKSIVLPGSGVGITAQKYTVLRNDDAVMSMTLALENCGAYCEEFSARYAFDVRNGRRLVPADLFTPQGLAAVGKLVQNNQVTALRTALQEIRKTANANGGPGASAAEKTGQEAMSKMIEDCLALPARANAVRFDWQLEATGMVFFKERCSNHALRALDTVGEFSQALSAEALRPYLSTYGRALLAHDKTMPPLPDLNLAGQVLRGKFNGRIPVTLLVNMPALTSDTAVPTVYFYDQYRQPIGLTSSVKKNRLTLTETDSTETPKPTIEAVAMPGHLSGKWVGKDRTMRLEAMP